MYQNVTFSLHTKKAIRMKQKWGDQSNGKLHNISQKKRQIELREISMNITSIVRHSIYEAQRQQGKVIVFGAVQSMQDRV